MELRVLEYFLAVAREQNITKAAEFLHLTQPTLSRQLADLEKEFDKQLFIRGKRKITLTDDGILFRKRAEEIIRLAERTVSEIKNSDLSPTGNIYIGSGESMSIKNIIRTAKQLQVSYPDIYFHIVSGDSADLLEHLDKGLLDFCILFSDIDRTKYEYFQLPYRERWGLLMRTDSVLAQKETLTISDLKQVPLIVSRQIEKNFNFFKCKQEDISDMKIVGTYNLINNAVFMAEEEMGYVLTLENLVNTNGTPLCFRPLCPEQTLDMFLVWKRYQPLSKVAEFFLNLIMNSIHK